VLGCVLLSGTAFAQASDGAMSDAEVESLRDTAAVPMERLAAFEKMLDQREHTIDTLVSKPHRPAFGSDMHDAFEEFGGIADELNDNLDDYSKNMRDVRKALPKLIAATDRWATSLRAAGEDERYRVVRRIALDTLKDTHDLAVEMQDAQAKYAKEHPEWAKAEQERVAQRSR
jgi:hypothetical protein